MKRRSLSASALLLLALLSSFSLGLLGPTPQRPPPPGIPLSRNRNKRSPICIIGAGASGLSAGIRLQKKGYTNILILEKEPIPGGKARTIIGPNLLPNPVGTVFTVISDKLSLQLLDEYGVETFEDTLDSAYFDPNNGCTMVQPPVNKTRIHPAIRRYGEVRRQYLRYLIPGYLNGVPPELMVSSYEWVITNNFTVLWEGITSYVTLFGYGSLMKLPAIYMLDSLDEFSLASAYNSSLRLITDWGQLWTRISWNFDIRYNVDILDVQRKEGTGKAVTITYTMPVKGKTRRFVTKCRSLIVAMPSTVEKLTRFNLDDAEYKVFSQVRHINYYSAVVNLPYSNYSSFLGYLRAIDYNYPINTAFGREGPPPPDGFYFVEPPGDARPMLYTFFGVLADSKYATYYAYKDGPPISLEEFERIGLQTMSLLNHPFGPNPPGPPVTEADYVQAFYWYYFPYFNMDTITPTIFAELEALQGYRNTFWLSSLRCFEVMEEVIKSAYDIVDRYF